MKVKSISLFGNSAQRRKAYRLFERTMKRLHGPNVIVERTDSGHATASIRQSGRKKGPAKNGTQPKRKAREVS